MDWSNIKQFNFTFAITGGAWLKDAAGNCEWISAPLIEKKMGAEWFDRQYQRQGIFTGCWIDVA